MKIIIHLFIFVSLCIFSNAQEAIFLHHSVGGYVYEEGNVEAWIADYNTQHGTAIHLTPRAYPSSPYPWDNYPYDYWNIWINENCNDSESGQECLSSLASNYDIIIFKHCYGGAAIEEDIESPDISSDRRSLENYKLQYRALRSTLDNYPDTKFILWTLTPQHRLRTDTDEATRAKTFVDWVKNEWLEEDGNPHNNIYIFDFWSIVAETDESPSEGEVNCLKYMYEKDHDSKDSHPNVQANEAVGPVFSQFFVNVAEGNMITKNGESRLNNKQPILCFPNPTQGLIHVPMASNNVKINITDILGNIIYTKRLKKNSGTIQIDISSNMAGLYNLCIIDNRNYVYTDKIILLK